MLQELYKRKMTRTYPVIDPSIIQLVPTTIEKDGRTIQTSEYKKVRFADANKQFNYYDFTISSIMSVGATNLLKPVSMRNVNAQAFSDELDNLGRQIDKFVESQTPPANEAQ